MKVAYPWGRLPGGGVGRSLHAEVRDGGRAVS
jgi:hypothetical protein